MATQVQLRRGTATQISTFTGALAELIYNETTGRLHICDGSTVGGNPVALLSDVSNIQMNIFRYAGNPNGVVTGNEGDLCCDPSTQIIHWKTVGSGNGNNSGWS